MNLDVSGKTFLIGASTDGLGLATAKALAGEGARVWIGGRHNDRLEDALDALRRVAGRDRVGGACYDVSDAHSLEGWVSGALEAWGPGIDGILANSGGPPPGGFSDFDDEAWTGAFNLLLLSAVRLTRAALPGLKANRGAILFVTSTSVKEPIDGLLLSNSLRSAVVGLSKSLSREFASFGIRSNCIAPGRFSTARVVRIDGSNAAKLGISEEEAKKRMVSTVPLGRYGDPVEFGRTAAWLLSPAASYLTGQVVSVDGGAVRGSW